MSNTAQAPGNPLIRKHGLRDSRALDGIDQAKPASNNAFMFSTPMPGGVALMAQARARGARRLFPLQLTGTPSALRVMPGFVRISSQMVPKIGTDPISATPPPALNAANGHAVYLKIQVTLNKTNEWVNGASLDNVTVHAANSVPSDTSNTFHVQLGMITEGGLVQSWVNSNLQIIVEDDGTGTGIGVCYLFAATGDFDPG